MWRAPDRSKKVWLQKLLTKVLVGEDVLNVCIDFGDDVRRRTMRGPEPIPTHASKPGTPLSETVGTSGYCGRRTLLAIAAGRSGLT